MGGVKAALFYAIVFSSPWLLTIKFRLGTTIILAVLFFSFLYLGTLLRTEGFYKSAPFF